MNRLVETLQYITRASYKTQETLKSLTLYVEPKEIYNIEQINILLEEAKTNSMILLLEITRQYDYEESKVCLHILVKHLSTCYEAYLLMSNLLPASVPKNLSNMFSANMLSLKQLSEQLESFAA